MVEVNGSNRCFYCGELINWEARFGIPSGEPIILHEIQADIIAIGNEETNNGKKTKFQIHAYCPKCKVINKFEIIKSFY